MTFVLYDSVGPNPRVVRMFAAEKGVPIERRRVDIVGGENRSPGFLRKNRFGGTPVLELDGGAYLSETVAICEYIEELSEASPLLGLTAGERARVRMWTRRVDLNFCAPLVLAFRGTLGRAMFEPRTPVVGEDAAEDLKRLAITCLCEFEQRLAESAHLACDDFTLADIVLFCFADFGSQTGLLSLDGLPHTQVWRDKIRSRPSALT